MDQLWESRTDGEYFKLYKITTEFPNKFREYYRMNITTFDYIMGSVKDVLQGYSTRVVPKVISNFFFACELGTADEGECGGRWNQLLCYP